MTDISKKEKVDIKSGLKEIVCYLTKIMNNSASNQSFPRNESFLGQTLDKLVCLDSYLNNT